MFQLNEVHMKLFYYFQEFFAQKCDASLFMFGSHSKKRPNNIVIGDVFDILNKAWIKTILCVW